MSKRECIKAAVFLSIFLILLVMLSYIVRTNGSVKDRFAGFYAEPRDSIEVMFFGPSCISCSMAPGYIWGEYGFKSYALSTNSQRTKAIIPLIEEAYSRQKPKVIVIDTRIFAYEDADFVEDEAHIREITDNMRYSLRRIRAIDRIAEKPGTDKLSYYLDIIKYHSNIGMLLKPSELGKFWYMKRDVNKGYEQETEETYHFNHEEWDEVEPLGIDPAQEAVLEELVEYLGNNDIEAVFVTSVTKPYMEFRRKIEYIDDFLTAEGYEHINLNKHYDDMGLHTAYDMSDGVHANSIGAAKCSAYIAEYLLDRYKLEDTRGSSDNSDWQEAYDLFNEAYRLMTDNSAGIKIWEVDESEYE